MFRIARAPPVTGLALAAGFGAVLIHLGVPLPWTLLPLPILLLPNLPWKRPRGELPSLSHPLAVAFLAGAVLAGEWQTLQRHDCRLLLREGQEIRASGSLSSPVTGGRGVLRPLGRGIDGCTRPVRIVVDGASPGPGRVLLVQGRWRRTGGEGGGAPEFAGYVKVDSLQLLGGEGRGGRGATLGAGIRGVVEALGGAVTARLAELFPERKGLAAALVWARKEGLDGEVRDAFARAGTAHLLAISGFHVGVVAGLLLLLGGALGLSHPLRFLLSSLGVWIYVTLIGLPDAAMRAALILTLLALGRLRRRAVVPLGAISTAFLLFLALEPGALLRPGFQLSFAGALGLVLGGRPIAGALQRPGMVSLPPPLASAVGAGVAATAATLPLVAWHFGRISLIGIPMTLLAAPLVTLAIPGLFLTLAASLIYLPLAHFLAAGVDLDLHLMETLVRGGAGLPLASIWISRPSAIAGGVGLVGGWLLLALLPPGSQSGRATAAGSGGRPTRARTSSLLPLWACFSAVLLAPLPGLLLDRHTVEIVALDVGQGDAILLRSPGGRWILVDAGPRSESFDAGARTVLPYMRRRGIPRLDLMVLSHSDMDHVGGAAAILQDFGVMRVMDPGVAVGKGVFLDALAAASDREVPWVAGRAGDSINLDGMALRVLSPDSAALVAAREDANEGSLVLELRYGAFAALLTGDAPISVEEGVLGRILSNRIQLLKAGHHGSSTSTGTLLLERIRPQAALISVGRRNRYGHPHAAVLERLEAGEVSVHRTDEEGTLRVKAWKDGHFRIR